MLMPYLVAHLVTTGLGPLYDGIGHFLTTPEDLVPAIALGLCAGLRGARAGRRVLFLLPAAWFVGGLLGQGAPWQTSFPVTTIFFLLLGVLVASDFELPAGAVAALAIGLGLVAGFSNGPALAGAGPGTLGLVGITAAVFVVVALVSGLVVALERPWTRIAVRVAGSWIAAVGLLLLGWALRATSR